MRIQMQGYNEGQVMQIIEGSQTLHYFLIMISQSPFNIHKYYSNYRIQYIYIYIKIVHKTQHSSIALQLTLILKKRLVNLYRMIDLKTDIATLSQQLNNQNKQLRNILSYFAPDIHHQHHHHHKQSNNSRIRKDYLEQTVKTGKQLRNTSIEESESDEGEVDVLSPKNMGTIKKTKRMGNKKDMKNNLSMKSNKILGNERSNRNVHSSRGNSKVYKCSQQNKDKNRRSSSQKKGSIMKISNKSLKIEHNYSQRKQSSKNICPTSLNNSIISRQSLHNPSLLQTIAHSPNQHPHTTSNKIELAIKLKLINPKHTLKL